MLPYAWRKNEVKHKIFQKLSSHIEFDIWFLAFNTARAALEVAFSQNVY